MAAVNKFTDFVLQLGLGSHDLQNDTFRMLLSNAAPSAAWTTVSQATEIAAGNGYAAGGFDIQNAYSLAAGVGTITAVDYLLTASGGPIGPFRYGIIYNASRASPAANLLGWVDYGASITLLDTQTFLADMAATLGTITW